MLGPGSGKTEVVSTGIPGLDDVLGGGLRRQRLYLIEGMPGSGKTTLALRFLMAAAARGEPVLYVTLSETAEELRSVAASHGWTLDGVTLRELIPNEGELDPDAQATMFHPSEIELATTLRQILTDVDRVNPTSIVFDSLSELRLLAGSALRYRRQILALKTYFAARGCTVLMLDDMTSSDRDLQVHSIAHGVILLEQLNPEYGNDRRRMRVVKFRGVSFRGGYHDYVIRRGGLEVFPRLVAAEHRQSISGGKLTSDLPQFDRLLGGGVELGTSTLLVGSAGTGKSTLAAQFVATAAKRGEHGAMFLFDESPATLLTRTAAMGIPLREGVEAGLVMIRSVDPAELSPGELIHLVRHEVEQRHVCIVVIDSLNGYLNAMPGEQYLAVQLHELLAYLGQHNVATLLVSVHQGLLGPMTTTVDASYLADAIILLRYFEVRGEIRQAVSVVKKRGSQHERTIREFRLEAGRIHVGRTLREFRGVLTGVPTWDSEAEPPAEDDDAGS